MKDNTVKYRNKYRVPSARLEKWDYSSAGYYFVTICTKNREPYFGQIFNDQMQLSKMGHIAHKYWLTIPNHFPFVTLDKFMVMPNHVHGIIIIKNHYPHVETPNLGVSTNQSHPNYWKSGCLGAIINQYKRVCTIKIRENGLFFAWQSRYYDHVIKNEKSFWAIRKYIEENPIRWESDEQNPLRLT